MGKCEVPDLECVKKHLDGKSFHGFSEAQYQELTHLILNVRPTDTATQTKFPDFICDKGFIEHFEVTSGNEQKEKGGAKIKQEKSKIKNELQRNMRKDSSLSHCEEFYERTNANDDLHLFIKSFKCNWNGKIERLRKYEGKKHVSCLLISSDDRLLVCEKALDDNGIFYGDIKEHQTKFELRHCLELLCYIYAFSDEIDYVIYLNRASETVEFLRTENIPSLIRLTAQREYRVYSSLESETIRCER